MAYTVNLVLKYSMETCRYTIFCWIFLLGLMILFIYRSRIIVFRNEYQKYERVVIILNHRNRLPHTSITSVFLLQEHRQYDQVPKVNEIIIISTAFSLI